MLWREGRQAKRIRSRGMSRGGMAIGGGLGGIVILVIAFARRVRQLLEQLPSDGRHPATQSSRPLPRRIRTSAVRRGGARRTEDV